MRIPNINAGRIMFVFILLEFFILLMAWWMDGFTLKGLQTATRFSGLLSLILFSFIFLFHHRRDIMNRWLSHKFYLLFAIVHGVYLTELFILIWLSEVQLIPYRVAGGSVAFIMIFLMPVLQQQTEKEK